MAPAFPRLLNLVRILPLVPARACALAIVATAFPD
jgi:hypothetical protein